MRYLLDTNVLSEPVRSRPDPRVLAQLEEHGSECCTAAIVLHELRHGVARRPEGRRRQGLERYLDGVVARLRVLPYDGPAAIWHASARAAAEARGRGTSFAAAQVAAVAAVNELAVGSRNVSDFEGLGVEVVSWQSAAGP
jgi:tRNA(fMet)-specific endonuclease VapC